MDYMQSLKIIYHWLLNFWNTVVSIIYIVLVNRGQINKKINILNGNRKNKSVSILANGSSVQNVIEENSDLLTHSDIMVLNNFANTEHFFKIKPQYYILLDPTYFDPNVVVESEINAKSEESQIELMRENFRKVNWNMVLFFPNTKKAINAINYYTENPYIKVVRYRGTRILGFDFYQNAMYKKNQGIPSSRNVIIPALILLINIGYKKIYLYGVEFSWTKTMDVDPENGMFFFNDRHFYAKSEIRYFDKGGYKWWLEAIVEMLNATEEVRKYADSQDVEIINRTSGSFIDAFKYENITELQSSKTA